MQQTTLISRDYDFLTLESIKQNANILIDDISNDDFLIMLKKVVVDYIAEKKGEISIATKQLSISNNEITNKIRIDDVMVQSIDSIVFSDLIERSFKLEKGQTHSFIHFADTLPVLDEITIIYKCGYTITPDRYAHAVRVGINNYFDSNRSNYSYQTIDNQVLEKLIGLL